MICNNYNMKNLPRLSANVPAVFALSLACFAGTPASAVEYWVDGVSKDSGWFDVSKYNISTQENFDSNTCGIVTAANMLAFWQSRHSGSILDSLPRGGKAIYDDMYRFFGDSAEMPSIAINKYLIFKGFDSRTYGASVGLNVPDSKTATALGSLNAPETAGERVAGKNGMDFYPYSGDATVSYYWGGDPGPEKNGGINTSMDFADLAKKAFALGSPIGLTLQPAGPLLSDGTRATNKNPHAITVWGVELDESGALIKFYYTNSDTAEGLEDSSTRGGITYDSGDLIFLGKGQYVDPIGQYIWLTDGGGANSWSFGDATILYDQAFVSAIPEPSTFGFALGFAALALVALRRRR